jgi:hypothetical protein
MEMPTSAVEQMNADVFMAVTTFGFAMVVVMLQRSLKTPYRSLPYTKSQATPSEYALSAKDPHPCCCDQSLRRYGTAKAHFQTYTVTRYASCHYRSATASMLLRLHETVRLCWLNLPCCASFVPTRSQQSRRRVLAPASLLLG